EWTCSALPISAATDDFFDVGGNSLLATQVAGRLTSTTGVEIGVRDVFDGRHRRGPGEDDRDRVARPGAAPNCARAQRRSTPVRSLRPSAGCGSSISLIPRPTCTTWTSRCAYRGDLVIGALEEAVRDVLGRHRVLRTTYTTGPTARCSAWATAPPSI
ncbi:hypothetical protein GS497_26095, partial [Rhodococcus hoagii]|nr:hypothetical protein [Prescottella equi]